MNGELMLNWMSEVESGTIKELRDRTEWLMRDSLTTHEGHHRFYEWLRRMTSLGHCEVDWARRRWSVTPLVIYRLPNADGLAALAGRRRQTLTPRLLQESENTDVWVDTRVMPQQGRGLPLPRVIQIQFNNASELEQLASNLGGRYVGTAAVRLASVLRPPSVGPIAAPPPGAESLEVLSTVSPPRFSSAPVTSYFRREGLYRYKRYGQRIHLYWDGENWRETDRERGVILEARRRGERVIRWVPEIVHGRGGVGSVVVEAGIAIPALHDRALVLCSGLTPAVSESGDVIYENVPRIVARTVADLLDASLLSLELGV